MLLGVQTFVGLFVQASVLHKATTCVVKLCSNLVVISSY